MFKPKQFAIVMLLLGGLSSAAFAETAVSVAELAQQNGTARGVIVDTQGPVIGASVQVKGTTNGTVTNLDGSFELRNVPAGATLVISSIGYETQEIIWNGQSLRITLAESNTLLDETVVVGYATQTKANLTGAVSTVNVAKDINQRTTNTISNLLAGAAPGLVALANSSSGSRAGANSAALTIRGVGTTNDSSPLVIVDGIVTSMDNVNPADVEAISILKDAASSAIYGSRAANGVILITTKSGKTGKPTVTYNGMYSLEAVDLSPKYYQIESNYADYMEWLNYARANTNSKAYFSQAKIDEWRAHENDTDPQSKLYWPNTDWTKVFFRVAQVQNHTISIQGGAENVRYFVSGNFYKNPGVIQWTDFQKFSLRSKLEVDITKFLTVGLNISGYRSEMDPCADVASADGDALTYGAAAGSPGIVLKSPDGRYGEFNNTEDNMGIVNANAFRRLNFYQHENPTVTQNIIPKFYAKITPFKGFEIEGSYTYNFTNRHIIHVLQDMDLWRYSPTEGEVRDLKTVNVYRRQYWYEWRYDTADLVARYNTKIGDLKIGALAGVSGEYYKYNFDYALKFNDETLAAGEHNDYRLTNTWATMTTAKAVADYMTGDLYEWAMRSYFGRINLNWADKYLFEANIRADGSSRFAPENRWGWFPSASAGWVISNEDFFNNAGLVNFLKLRVSYGALGNNAIGNYDWQSVYGTYNGVWNNGTNAGGLSINSISNRSITWEKTTVTNIGLDFNMLRSRLNGTLELYDKTTDGILLSIPASLTNGNVTIPKQNAAVVQNRGVEFQLRWNDHIGKDFSYYISGNVAYNKNKVIDYAVPVVGTYNIEVGQPLYYLNVVPVDRLVRTDEDVAYIDELLKTKPNLFKTWVRPEKGDILYADANGDGVLDTGDRVKFSNGNAPVWTYGLSLGFDWKGFDFSAIFNGIADWKDIMLDALLWCPSPRYGYSLNKYIKDNSYQPGVNELTATFPRALDYSTDQTRNRRVSEFWVYDRAYFRLRNVQIGYTIPANITRKAAISNLRIFCSVDNAFTLTNWPGLDPEIGTSRAKQNSPVTRVTTFGVNVTL